MERLTTTTSFDKRKSQSYQKRSKMGRGKSDVIVVVFDPGMLVVVGFLIIVAIPVLAIVSWFMVPASAIRYEEAMGWYSGNLTVYQNNMSRYANDSQIRQCMVRNVSTINTYDCGQYDCYSFSYTLSLNDRERTFSNSYTKRAQAQTGLPILNDTISCYYFDGTLWLIAPLLPVAPESPPKTEKVAWVIVFYVFTPVAVIELLVLGHCLKYQKKWAYWCRSQEIHHTQV